LKYHAVWLSVTVTAFLLQTSQYLSGDVTSGTCGRRACGKGKCYNDVRAANAMTDAWLWLV